MFGKGRFMTAKELKEAEMLKLKEQITAKDIEIPKPSLDSGNFIKRLSELVTAFVLTERDKTRATCDHEKAEAIIKAKQEQFDDDVRSFEDKKKALKQIILRDLEETINEAKNQHNGEVALIFLGALKRRIEKL